MGISGMDRRIMGDEEAQNKCRCSRNRTLTLVICLWKYGDLLRINPCPLKGLASTRPGVMLLGARVLST